ncbi:MAG: hypothetical protein LBR38_01200 [Synergistaceae bacterium]|jgi:UPF0042 nucleotide-binding protein|nr:hypothetical protein [Synergistaceae bacterium]
MSALLLSSFGFKYGVPEDANYVIDVRFLPNPFYVAELKDLSGLDEPVRSYIEAFDETEEFFAACAAFLDLVVRRYSKGTTVPGRPRLHIAIGCTGGRHRSVAVVERLAERYRDAPGGVEVVHRDMWRR